MATKRIEMLAKSSALFVALLMVPVRAAADSATPEECRSSIEAAKAQMGRGVTRAGPSPSIRGKRMLRSAIEICARAAESARDPELAAEMKAEEYLARADLAPSFRKPGEQWDAEVLLEGVEAIRGLHDDRSPASIILLRKAGHRHYGEDPKYAHELIELAVELAREAYGEQDSRYADELRNLALLHSPHPIHARTGTVLADPDPTKAEGLLREALGIYLLDDTPTQLEGYRRTLNMLEGLYEATGREKEAGELGELAAEAYAEIGREQEAKALEEEPSAEDEEGENTPIRL